MHEVLQVVGRYPVIERQHGGSGRSGDFQEVPGRLEGNPIKIKRLEGFELRNTLHSGVARRRVIETEILESLEDDDLGKPAIGDFRAAEVKRNEFFEGRNLSER